MRSPKEKKKQRPPHLSFAGFQFFLFLFVAKGFLFKIGHLTADDVTGARTNQFHGTVGFRFVTSIMQPVSNVVAPDGQRGQHFVAHAVGFFFVLFGIDLDTDGGQQVLVTLFDSFQDINTIFTVVHGTTDFGTNFY